MTALPRRGVGVVVVLVALIGIGALSRVPLAAREHAVAELRLSWRMRSEPERVCRTRTPEELARLPVHMREEEVCERRTLPYRLNVTVDGVMLENRVVLAAGAQGNRPFHVFGGFPLQPGVRTVRIELTREGGDTLSPPVAHPRDGAAPTHALPQRGPQQLVLDTSLTVGRGEVRVVTFDEQAERLRVIGARGP